MSVAERLVIAVVGRKGGAGKTTTAFNLAGVLAEKGAPVTLFDLDPQQSLSRLMEGRTPWGATVLPLGPAAASQDGRQVAPWLGSLLDREHGYVVIDTPPQLGAIIEAAIARADRVVIPTRLAQQDIDSLLDTLTLCPAGALIVPNLYANRRTLHRAAVAALRESYGDEVAKKEIPDSAVIEEALNAGSPVVRFSRRSAPAVAYRALAAEVA